MSVINNSNNQDKKEVMLSTIDNPYDPFTQFEEWFEFDTTQGYDTCNYLDRVAIWSPDLTEADEDLAIELAIDEIVQVNVLGIYIKVVEGEFKERNIVIDS